MDEGLKARFLEKIEKRDGKWVWKASVNSDGYPKMKDNGKLRLASHVALELVGREAPKKGKVVLHKNNDPKDVNPANLSVSTQKANLKQMRDQGRDRPRGVDQEPDVKQGSVHQPLPPPTIAANQIAKNVFKKKAFSAFSEELQRLLAKS